MFSMGEGIYFGTGCCGKLANFSGIEHEWHEVEETDFVLIRRGGDRGYTGFIGWQTEERYRCIF